MSFVKSLLCSEVAGLSGTLKSKYGDELAKPMGLSLLRDDAVETGLAGSPTELELRTEEEEEVSIEGAGEGPGREVGTAVGDLIGRPSSIMMFMTFAQSASLWNLTCILRICTASEKSQTTYPDT